MKFEPITDMPNKVFCRIHGLQSVKGRALNGFAAHYDPSTPPHPKATGAWVSPLTVSLLHSPENLQMFSSPSLDLGVAAGRGSLLSKEIMTVVVDNARGVRCSNRMIEASPKEPNRSKRSLIALKDFFQQNKKTDFGKQCVISVTDLNVARILNKICYQEELGDVSLHTSQQSLA